MKWVENCDRLPVEEKKPFPRNSQGLSREQEVPSGAIIEYFAWQSFPSDGNREEEGAAS